MLVLFTDDVLNTQERHEGLLRELQELAQHGPSNTAKSSVMRHALSDSSSIVHQYQSCTGP